MKQHGRQQLQKWQTTPDQTLTTTVSFLSAPLAQIEPMYFRCPYLVLLAFAAAFPLLMATPVAADSDNVSHEEARRLVEAGKIRPLQEIVEMLRVTVPGRHLETELEYDDSGSGLVYDFKILRPGGRIQEVEVDAVNGAILKIEDDD